MTSRQERLQRLGLGRAPARFVSTTLWVGVLQTLPRLQSLVLVVVSTRLLTPSSFGTFFGVQAVALLFASLWDFGSTSFLMRESATKPAQAALLARSTMRVRLVSSPGWLVAAVAVCAVGSVRTSLGVVTALTLLLASGLAAVGTVYNAVLVGGGHVAGAARTASTNRTLVAAALGLFLFGADAWPTSPQLGLAVILAFGEAVLCLRQRLLAKRAFPSDNTATTIPARQFVRGWSPYAGNAMLNYAYNKADLLLVTGLAGVLAVATYTPGSQLQNVLAVIPALVCGALVPLTSTDAHDLRRLARLRRVTARLVPLSLGVGLVALALLLWLIPRYLPVVLGRPDPGAIEVAVILALGLPFLAVSVPLSQALIASGNAGKTTRAFLAGFVATVLAHLALDWKYGAVGAAWASLLRDPVVMLAMIIAYSRCVGFRSPSPVDPR